MNCRLDILLPEFKLPSEKKKLAREGTQRKLNRKFCEVYLFFRQIKEKKDNYKFLIGILIFLIC